MTKLIRRGKSKAGLPPGSLVYVGVKDRPSMRITLFDYDAERYVEKTISNLEECVPFKEQKTITWINVDGLADTAFIARLDQLFGVHTLVLEDVVNTDQRPKMEDYGDYIYVVLKMLYIEKQTQNIISEQLSLVIGSNYVLSFQEKEGDYFDNIRDRIRTAKGRVRKMGADYLAYVLLDTIVDNYFLVLEKMEEDIAQVEEKLMSAAGKVTSSEIHHLKRDLIFLRKQISPVRELINALQRADSKLIHKTTEIYLRDLHDHIISVMDAVESFRDILSGLHDIYLSSINLKMNEIMKVLTIISTIFIPLTFIAGVYGMNFKYMPELEWETGYFEVLALMLVLALVMVLYFKRKKWL
jgi:magnesium transporter